MGWAATRGRRNWAIAGALYLAFVSVDTIGWTKARSVWAQLAAVAIGAAASALFCLGLFAVTARIQRSRWGDAIATRIVSSMVSSVLVWIIAGVVSAHDHGFGGELLVGVIDGLAIAVAVHLAWGGFARRGESLPARRISGGRARGAKRAPRGTA